MGIDVGTLTPKDELSSLINSLHPVDSGKELIRLGPSGDGGYLLPDDLEGIKYCFSPGVSSESGFEAALARQGLKVFLADFSVDAPAEFHDNFVFDKKFIGALSNQTFMTLNQWKDSKISNYSGDLILQMDIEGAEFETLFSVSADLLNQFRIMVIEFHYLQELFNKRFFLLASRVFQKLLQTHSVVHIHPNNCCGSIKGNGLEIPRVAEFTFYRKDRFSNPSYRQSFPHVLDRNNTRKSTLVLPSCWYRG
ncbi:MAG: hypothetical protein CMD70_07440 [Gammaproteobacteria bacterium]|nr:hypothetical protein [Gammaproteobacteria bacterium]